MKSLLNLLTLLVPLSAIAADDVIIRQGDAVVTLADMDAKASEVPADKRAGVMSNPENLQRSISALLDTKLMATAAKEAGLLEDPMVKARLDLAIARALETEMRAKIRRDAHGADFEQLAREQYLLNRNKFKTEAAVDVSHILISNEEPMLAQAKAAEIIAQLEAGASFDELAAAHSIDTATAAKGGALGPINKGKTLPAFEDAAFALEKQGDISDAVETRFGLHIIQLNERIDAGYQSFDDVKDQLIAIEVARAEGEAVRRFMAKLKEQPVEANDELMFSLRSRYLSESKD